MHRCKSRRAVLLYPITRNNNCIQHFIVAIGRYIVIAIQSDKLHSLSYYINVTVEIVKTDNKYLYENQLTCCAVIRVFT